MNKEAALLLVLFLLQWVNYQWTLRQFEKNIDKLMDLYRDHLAELRKLAAERNP
jgi:hypothetical protein